MPTWTLKVLTFKVCVSIRCTICVVLQCSAMILVMQRFRVVFRRISHGYTTKKGCITVSYHAIENTDGKGWVWYSWTARIDGEVRWNTDEYTTASFPAFWLAVFSMAWYKMQYALLITVDFVLFLINLQFDNRTTRVLPMFTLCRRNIKTHLFLTVRPTVWSVKKTDFDQRRSWNRRHVNSAFRKRWSCGFFFCPSFSTNPKWPVNVAFSNFSGVV